MLCLGRSPCVRLAMLSLAIGLASAGCSERETAGPVIAQASARLVQIRPRHTVEPSAELAYDPNSITSWWPVQGTASFRTTSEGVDVALALRDCRTGYSYPVRIYDQSCEDVRADSKPWDWPRGKLATNALCVGAPGARLYDSRKPSEPKPWSLGGAASSDLIGRALVVHDPDTAEPLACGTIEPEKDGAPYEPADPATLSERVAAEAANYCIFRLASRHTNAAATCPDVVELGRCTRVHCVDHCRSACSDHLTCLAAQPECSGACEPEEACRKCLDASCGFGFCRKQLKCSEPTPNGPCSELRACCARQGPLMGACLEFVELMEDTSGDVSCLGTLNDWDFNTNFAYRSPCYQEGFAPEPE